MKISEIFQQSSSTLPADITYNPRNLNIYQFEIGGIRYGVSVMPLHLSVLIGYRLDDYSPDIDIGLYMVTFSSITDDNSVGRFTITGSGNAAQVLQKVYDCLGHFLNTHPSCRGFAFSAYEPSRIKLYDVLTKKIASKHGLEVYVPNTDYTKEKWYLISDQKTIKKADNIIRARITSIKKYDNPSSIKNWIKSKLSPKQQG